MPTLIGSSSKENNMKVQVKKFNGEYFCKYHNFLPDNIVKDVIKDSSKRISKDKNKPIGISVCSSPVSETSDVFPPESSRGFLKSIKNDNYIWNTVIERSKLAMVQYCKLADIDHTRLELHSMFATRLYRLPKDDEYAENRMRLFSPYKNLHTEKWLTIKVIIYLEVPKPEYGTMIQVDEKKIYLHEPENNSAIAFNPALPHSANYPPLDVIKKSARRTIEIDAKLIPKNIGNDPY